MTEPAEAELSCPRCGALVTAEQEYCVECGLRLPSEGGMRAAVASTLERRSPWYPGEWLWPTLVALVVALLATAAVLAAQDSREADQEPFLATTAPAAQPVPPPVDEPTGTTPTLGEPPLEEEPLEPPLEEEPPLEPPPANELIDWPDGTNGFTVVLASLPETGGRPPALARAREALDAGLPDPGVLRSAEYSSLHPGYFVVFSGVYGSYAEAEAALGSARAAGFDAPYVREVAS